jgi:hypothetical protein
MFCVKPLRLASFRAVLEDLGNAAPEDCRPPDGGARDAPFGHSARCERFGSLLSAMARGSWNFVSPSSLSHLYAEARAGAASESPRGMSEAEMVAGELCLRPRLTAQELRRIRREFALGNHPDRVPAPLRERATRRMIIANTLIDQALKALSSQ